MIVGDSFANPKAPFAGLFLFLFLLYIVAFFKIEEYNPQHRTIA